jgi:hypothetical protein
VRTHKKKDYCDCCLTALIALNGRRGSRRPGPLPPAARKDALEPTQATAGVPTPARPFVGANRIGRK